MPEHVKDSSWRESFHAAAMTSGGERSCISAAVSLSMTFIGPSHLGQRQRSLDSLVEGASCSAGGSGCAPSKLKAKRQACGASAVGQEAEVADANETLREQMQQEAAQELIDS